MCSVILIIVGICVAMCIAAWFVVQSARPTKYEMKIGLGRPAGEPETDRKYDY